MIKKLNNIMKQMNSVIRKISMLLLATFCVSAITMITSCESDDVQPTPSFYIEEDYSNIIIGHTAYNNSSPYHYYTVRAVGEWQIVPVEEYSWVSSFPNEGKDEGVFRIIAKANDAVTERTAQFKIIAGGVEQPVLINVLQGANDPYITITARNEQGNREEKSAIDIPGPANQLFYLFVRSNIVWDFQVSDNNSTNGGDDDNGENPVIPVDWITAVKVQGDSIKVEAEMNLSDEARSAVITFFMVDNPNVRNSVTINQGAGSYLKVPTTLFEISRFSQTRSCYVDANIPWEVVPNNSWISAGIGTNNVLLTFQENTTGALRTGTVTIFSPIDPVRFSHTVTIDQDERGAITGFENPVEWEFTAAHYGTGVYTTQFVSNNALKSGKGTETATGTSTISYVSNYPGTDTDIARLIGTTGHPYVTGAWPGDWWLFTCPVTNLRIADKLNIKFITRSSATGHKYWMLECFDDGVWKPVGQVRTENVSGLGVVSYTHAMNADGNTNVEVNSTYTFTKRIQAGDVLFRFRCMANWQASGSGALANPNGGTHRLAGAVGTSPVISYEP